ncbi:MAG: type II secretion system F family protein [Bdellovibrio sp.]|nr:type II secretion system F family protein [Bdellovibrio sp.]
MISKNTFADWCEGLSDYLDAGMDLNTYLEDFNGKGMRLKKYNQKIKKEIAKGPSLSEALVLPRGEGKGSFYPIVFHASEVAGRLPQAMRVLADFIRFEDRYQSKIKSMIVGLFVKISAVAIFLAGSMLLLAKIGRADIDFLGLGLHGMSGAMTFLKYTGLFQILLISIIMILYKFKNAPLLEMFMMKWPYLGGCMKSFLMYRVTFVMSEVFRAGMEIQEALTLTYQSSGSFNFKRYLPRVLARINAGDSLCNSFLKHRKLPEKFVQTLKHAERSGNIPQAMQRLCHQYRLECQNHLEKIQDATFMLTKVFMFLFCIILIGSIIKGVALEPLTQVLSRF